MKLLHTRSSIQNEMEFVCLEDLVPENHLLRKIDKHIDFSFILEKVGLTTVKITAVPR